MKKNSKNVLVIAAHPDDEVLGCGATIAKHAAHGDEVTIVILAEGARSRGQKGADKQIAELKQIAARSAKILGVKKLITKDFPDNEMDTVSELKVTKVIEDIIRSVKPNIVYTHHRSDVNVDHRRIFESVVVATRPQPGQTVEQVFSFEVASSTEWQLASTRQFEPNWFVDVTSTWDKKIEALECYAGELRPWPHARSIEAIKAQLKWRGATVGVEAAEAFMLLRGIS